MKTQIEWTVWLALVLLSVLAAASGADAQESFQYTITATGTEPTTNYPPQSFTYTVTGTGTETWNEMVNTNRSQSFSIENKTAGTYGRSFQFTATFSGKASIRYNLDGEASFGFSRGAASSMSLEVDGKTFFSATTRPEGKDKSGSHEFDVVVGKTYTLDLETSGELGKVRASATVKLPDRVSLPFTAQRAATEIRATPVNVSASDKDKEIAPVGVNAFPKPEKGGQMTNIKYQVTDNNDRVESWISGTSVYARTSHSEIQQKAWSAEEKGSATISAADGEKLVATSKLIAPNKDTKWSATSSNPNVEIRMAGNQLFAKVKAALPVITQQPQSQTIPAGSNVVFSVSATGSPPLKYQWRQNGTNLSGATNSTLNLSNVLANLSGQKYSVIVSNAVGSVTSQEAILTVTSVPSTTNFVLRQLPSGYVPAVAFTVTLQAQPPSSTQSYLVEDQPLANWTVTNISHGGLFDAPNRKVKFGPFFDNSSRALTYQATPPASETGEKCFSGIVSADGANSGIGGDLCVKPVENHPADINAPVLRLTAEEVTGYGAAWKRGTDWQKGPNPIPPEYVTRAGFLWKSGECYKLDSSKATNAPLWWVSEPCAGAPAQVGTQVSRLYAKSTRSSSRAVRQLVPESRANLPLEVKLSIAPASGVIAYVVVEEVPEGWRVSEISAEGHFDQKHRKVKWGPYFDDTPRALTYRAAANSFSGTAAFRGVASFDGTNLAIADRGTTDSAIPIRISLAVFQPLADGELQLQISGPLGGRYIVEYATDFPGGDWAVLTSFTSTTATTLIRESGKPLDRSRFYRVKVQP